MAERADLARPDVRAINRRTWQWAVGLPVVTVGVSFLLFSLHVHFWLVIWLLPLVGVIAVKISGDHAARAMRGATAEDRNLLFDLGTNSKFWPIMALWSAVVFPLVLVVAVVLALMGR